MPYQLDLKNIYACSWINIFYTVQRNQVSRNQCGTHGKVSDTSAQNSANQIFYNLNIS